MSKRQYWLMKSEPDAYSIDDLKRDGKIRWSGVRNYEARNSMRDEMNVGDRALFYHSNVKPPAIVGTMEVCSEPYPDPLQFDPESKYFDEKSSESDPRWHLVDVKFVQKFEEPVTRTSLKEDSFFDEMQLFKRNRLSITSVREEEYKKILEMAGTEEK
ncbi:EVE domain-containing protein [Rhodohalobacter sp. SW132]|uniref:EVE domain-containing protein n=1 Tax=Rhodohalobacter sp. SW132 TaxID=2293433 RepID=UPI001F47FB4F|nr:EVE domain-containing protein [Rhodohalobacter sp. SW132]